MEVAVFMSLAVVIGAGILINLWRMVVSMFTTLFIFAAVVLVVGYIFGGADAITDPTANQWVAILDIVFGKDSGDRIVTALIVFWENTKAIHMKYW